MPARDPSAPELRAVTALLLDGARLVAPITLVQHGSRVIGVTSSELLRTLPDDKLSIATSLDGTTSVPIASWGVGRYASIALVELAAALPESDEIVPLSIGSIHASVNIHAAPAAILAIEQQGHRFERSLVPVHVDADDAGGMSDRITYLASPHHPAHAGTFVEGATAFAWLPPEPALGRRTSEVVAFAMAFPYRHGIAKPRDTAVFAELAGLDDIGRALISGNVHEAEPELKTVAGEIEDPEKRKTDEIDPLAGFKDEP